MAPTPDNEKCRNNAQNKCTKGGADKASDLQSNGMEELILGIPVPPRPVPPPEYGPCTPMSMPSLVASDAREAPVPEEVDDPCEDPKEEAPSRPATAYAWQKKTRLEGDWRQEDPSDVQSLYG